MSHVVVTTDVMDSPVGGLGAGRVDGLPSIAQNESHRAFLVMNPAEDRWFGVTAAPSPLSAFATNSRSNDGLAIALVAVASSLTILCMRLFSRSIARRVSRVRRAIGFRGSTMSHSFKKNVQTTRRILLQTAIGAVSAVSFLGLTARGARAAKSSKSDVGYQDSPKGNQQCDDCRQFIPPNACKQVEGVISPSGWCKMWAKKAG